jgi:polyhydroxyalkanoate synthesis regulator phasin
MAKNTLQRLLDAGVQFGEMSRKQAEGVVKQLVKAGAVRRSESEASVQALLDRSRETATAIGESVQREVTKQLGRLVKRVDELEDELESMVSRFNPVASRAPATSTATTATSATAATKAPAKRATTKRAPAKRTAVKKTAARKTRASKAPAKRAPSKRAPTKTTGAREVTGPSG